MTRSGRNSPRRCATPASRTIRSGSIPKTNHLFATLLLADNNTVDKLPETEINRRWWDFMADIMLYDARNQPVVVPLDNVFHMA